MATLSIPLTQGKSVVIDEADAEIVNRHRWYAKLSEGHWYATTKQGIGADRRTLLMHRLLMGEPKGLAIDHRDGDGLNNTRANLRIATTQQNAWNSEFYRGGASKYIGVQWSKYGRKWCARIRVDGRQKWLGVFTNEEDAARAYDAAVRLYRDEFARLNFPESEAA